MKLAKKALAAIVLALALFSVGGFFILPKILKPVLIDKIFQKLGREAALEEIKINPFDLSITVRDFQLADLGEKKPFLAFEQLLVNVDVPASLHRRALILEEIRLDKPYLSVIRKEDGTYNFSDLLPKQEEKKEKDSPPFLFSFNNIRISGGKIDFCDTPHQTTHSAQDLELAIPFVSNIDYYLKNYVEPRFSAVVNGHPFKATGQTRPFLESRDTSLNIDIRDISIPFYLRYVPVKMNFRLLETRLDVNLQLHFIINEKKAPQMKLTGQLDLRKVQLDDLRGNKILRLPALTVKIASLEPFSQSAHLEEILLDEPQLVVKREKNGSLNLLELAGAAPQNKTSGTAPAKKPEREGKKTKTPRVLIDRLLVERADISISDAQPVRPVAFHIQPLHLQATGINWPKQSIANAKLELVLDKKTEIQLQGPVNIAPLAADLQLSVKNLLIRPFQPYFPPNLQMDVAKGGVSTEGKLLFKMDAKNQPVIQYGGNLAIAGLAILDREHHQDFLKWKTMSVSNLRASYNPLAINIQEIAFADIFAKIVIHAGGRSNIEDILGQPPKETTPKDIAKETKMASLPTPPLENEKQPEKPALPPPDIKIAKVSFTGGTINFADYNIKPNYAVTLLKLKGDVIGLSSQETSRAKVALKGNLGHGSPIDISGAINPLKKDLFADINISFKDIEMTPVTPYASKYLGYPITKGKLTFDVYYLIDQKKLSAENKIFFDQLTFGDKVESPDAIKVPVTLAVSLLTDREGRINLDIPLSGSLEDPKFKIWPLVWQVLKNLITKAVTAPFALLSSLTGGGEEMSFVEFDYGSAQLSQDGQKKVGALSKVLYSRPNLKLEIEGYADAAQDAEALKKARFTRLLQAQKFKEIMDKGENPGQIEEISIAPEEYDKYLTLAYTAAKFTKPRNVVGLAKKLPPAEMEKLLQLQIVVTENHLRDLSASRSATVRESLLEDARVEPARLFLTTPKTLTPEKKEKVKNSRVEFKLK